MAYRSGFFNAKQNTDGSYDRTYDANDISNYLGGLISDGVVQSSADALQVSVEQASMQVQIRPGRAFLNNRWFTADSVITLPLTRAHGTLSRITAVALHFDEVNREVIPVCIDGTLASSPVAPQLDNKYLLLALVTVPVNPSNLSQITVTDSRKFVHALVNYDFDQSVLQKEYIKAFNAWFESVKNQLGSDVAGNLQNQINALKEDASSGAAIQELQKKISEIAPKLEGLQRNVEATKNAVSKVTDAFEIDGQNVKAKGSFEFEQKINAKKGLIIGGNDTLIVRRFSGSSNKSTLKAAVNDKEYLIIKGSTPTGYQPLGVLSACTDTRAGIVVNNFASNSPEQFSIYCTVYNLTGREGVPIEADIDVLFYKNNR